MKSYNSIAPLCYIQLLDKQGFSDKGAHWMSSSKTKNLFIVIPASLAG